MKAEMNKTTCVLILMGCLGFFVIMVNMRIFSRVYTNESSFTIDNIMKIVKQQQLEIDFLRSQLDADTPRFVHKQLIVCKTSFVLALKLHHEVLYLISRYFIVTRVIFI